MQCVLTFLPNIMRMSVMLNWDQSSSHWGNSRPSMKTNYSSFGLFKWDWSLCQCWSCSNHQLHTMDKDDCDPQADFIAFQHQAIGRHNLISYWSTSVIHPQRTHDITHKECLDRDWVIIIPGPYVKGAWITVLTKHDTGGWTMILSHASVTVGPSRLYMCELIMVHGASVNLELCMHSHDSRSMGTIHPY